MCIQRQKAIDQDIEFFSTFVNIKEDQHFIDAEGESMHFSPIVNSDRQRVMQVLLGLQSNALKFTKEGKVEIVVEIVHEQDEVYLKISVVDTGIGIPINQQKKLFKLFGFVEETAQLNTNGIGLGLVISDQIVH